MMEKSAAIHAAVPGVNLRTRKMTVNNHQQTKLEIACEIEAVASEFGAHGTDINNAISEALARIAFRLRENVKKEQSDESSKI